jgi:NAD(P)-dependent dehydrogenase (short-subunit alcohol dehydrogenase family)
MVQGKVKTNQSSYTATQGMPDMTDAAAVSAHFLQSHESSWADTFKTNVTAPYWMSIALLPLLAKSKKSNPEATPLVICVTSVAGSLKSTSGGQFSYAASKAASTHLGRMLATTFKDTGVRVNTVAPGVYPSEMNPIKPSDGKAESSVNLANPCGRVGADSDIGGTVVFLASKAGSYFTGQILYPDGGEF